EGFAARTQPECGSRVGPVRAAVPCNALGRTDMANNPKRIQDPTEAAMSAIQEALNLREEPPAPPPPPRPAASEPSPTAPVPDPFAHMTAGVEAERPTRRRPTRSTPAIDEDLFLQDT